MNLKRTILSTISAGARRKWRVRSVLLGLFRLCLGLALVWLVWSYALSHFAAAGDAGSMVSFGVCASLCAMSVILDGGKR